MAACVRLVLVKGEMDLTRRGRRGERGGMGFLFDWLVELPPPSLFAFLVLKRNILFCPCGTAMIKMIEE
jgi:hypothetical protein